jgi:hypothetical protein
VAAAVVEHFGFRRDQVFGKHQAHKAVTQSCEAQ